MQCKLPPHEIGCALELHCYDFIKIIDNLNYDYNYFKFVFNFLLKINPFSSDINKVHNHLSKDKFRRKLNT